MYESKSHKNKLLKYENEFMDQIYKIFKMSLTIRNKLICKTSKDKMNSLQQSRVRINNLVLDKINLLTARVIEKTELFSENQILKTKFLQKKMYESSNSEQIKRKEFSLSFIKKNLCVSLWVIPTSNWPARAKPVELENLGVHVEIPKSLFSKKIILRGLFSSELINEHINKFTNKEVRVIGLLDIAFFQVPEFTETINNYSFQQFYEGTQALVRIDYPDRNGFDSNNVKSFNIIYELPSNYFLKDPDDIQVFCFDEQTNQWTDDQIENISLSSNTDKNCKNLTFSMLKTTPMIIGLKKNIGIF